MKGNLETERRLADPAMLAFNWGSSHVGEAILEYLAPGNFLDQHFPTQLSVMRAKVYNYPIQYDSY